MTGTCDHHVCCQSNGYVGGNNDEVPVSLKFFASSLLVSNLNVVSLDVREGERGERNCQAGQLTRLIPVRGVRCSLRTSELSK